MQEIAHMSPQTPQGINSKRITVMVIAVIIVVGIITGAIVFLSQRAKQTSNATNTTSTATSKTVTYSAFNLNVQTPTNWTSTENTTSTEQGELTVQGPEGLVRFIFGGGFGGGPCESFGGKNENVTTQSGTLMECHTIKADGSESWSVAGDSTLSQTSNGAQINFIATVNAGAKTNNSTVLGVIQSAKY